MELSCICSRCGKMLQKTRAKELKNYTVRLVQVKCMKDNEDDLIDLIFCHEGEYLSFDVVYTRFALPDMKTQIFTFMIKY